MDDSCSEDDGICPYRFVCSRRSGIAAALYDKAPAGCQCDPNMAYAGAECEQAPAVLVTVLFGSTTVLMFYTTYYLISRMLWLIKLKVREVCQDFSFRGCSSFTPALFSVFRMKIRWGLGFTAFEFLASLLLSLVPLINFTRLRRVPYEIWWAQKGGQVLFLFLAETFHFAGCLCFLMRWLELSLLAYPRAMLETNSKFVLVMVVSMVQFWKWFLLQEGLLLRVAFIHLATQVLYAGWLFYTTGRLQQVLSVVQHSASPSGQRAFYIGQSLIQINRRLNNRTAFAVSACLGYLMSTASPEAPRWSAILLFNACLVSYCLVTMAHTKFLSQQRVGVAMGPLPSAQDNFRIAYDADRIRRTRRYRGRLPSTGVRAGPGQAAPAGARLWSSLSRITEVASRLSFPGGTSHSSQLGVRSSQQWAQSSRSRAPTSGHAPAHNTHSTLGPGAARSESSFGLLDAAGKPRPGQQQPRRSGGSATLRHHLARKLGLLSPAADTPSHRHRAVTNATPGESNTAAAAAVASQASRQSSPKHQRSIAGQRNFFAEGEEFTAAVERSNSTMMLRDDLSESDTQQQKEGSTLKSPTPRRYRGSGESS
mmetsp:Transcript_42645/g.69527  ORF Transcript_42645/g.69527 Transcript_42645/m.69527 type:complete len:594 (-) Transcript_42645:84-1865(-)